ncbi:GGDEF domain-containing protein [Nanoarchaeota archaeon]
MNDRIKELEVLLEFIESTYFSQSTKELLQKSSDFFVNRFKLSNCYIELFNTHYRFFTNSHLSKLYSSAEDRIKSVISNTKTPYFVSDPRDPLFTGIEGLDHSIFAFPIVVNRNHIGNLFLYGDTYIRQYNDLMLKIIEKLVVAALQVKNYTEVKFSAITDSMTGLYNKTYFQEALKQELARANAEEKPTSLVILDIDNFKNYNDTNGHLEGDELLKGLSEKILGHTSTMQTASRFGGEEFVILLPLTKTEEAMEWAESLRKDIAENLPATVSLGICTCLNSSASHSHMMKTADQAMYKSKRTGKNRTSNFLIIDKALGVIDVQQA